MKKIAYILILQSLIVSCGFFGSRSEDSEKINLTIAPGLAGDYKIGQKIDDIRLTNNQTTTSVEVPVGEGEVETRVFLKDNNLDLLKFSCNEKNLITEIEILSPLYKTAQGIGTGSRLATLMEELNVTKIWYTYVSDRFVAEAEGMPDIQFIIDPDSFTGDRDRLFDSDMIILSGDMFSQEARIVSIRIF